MFLVPINVSASQSRAKTSLEQLKLFFLSWSETLFLRLGVKISSTEADSLKSKVVTLPRQVVKARPFQEIIVLVLSDFYNLTLQCYKF